MIETCLIDNTKNCKRIKNHEVMNDLSINFGFAFDWNSTSDNPAFIYDLYIKEFKPMIESFSLKSKFYKIGGKKRVVFTVIYAI